MAVGGKKGIFFTFAAIVLAIVIILSFNVYTGYRLKDQMEVTEIRIITMNNFIQDLENDMDNAIYIAGFRSLLSLEDYMMENDKFFDSDGILAPSLDSAFEEAFSSGTITFEGDTEDMPLMKGNTFLNWTERIIAQANKTGIELEFNVDSVTISQSDPWIVEVIVRLDIDVEDEKDIASWTITDKYYTGQINITTPPSASSSQKKFVDPLYLIEYNGDVNNTIRETTETFPGGSLSYHLDNYFYIAHSDAPSYLDRFENKPGPDSNGIESIVTEKLKDWGLPVNTAYSAVDYLYFKGSLSNCRVAGFADFYLDDGHIGLDPYDASCQSS